MYEIKEKSREIHGVKVTTWQREILSANILEVEAGTNGYQGGDSGHGGRTYLRIQDLSSTDIQVRVLGKEGGEHGVELVMGGDAELSSLIDALDFALKALRDGIKEA
ncbi:MAG TPA: hypothetical protein PLH38_04230 [Clostridia bacterium]|nr:hypothetical protein [Clostridia bacterium]